MLRLSIAACFVGVCVLLSVATSLGEVTRYEIHSREPFADGKSFGDVGPYEVIRGKVHFRIDAKHAANAAIRDLQLAPQDDEAGVEFEADLFVLAPQDLSRGNGTALYDVNNRGNKLALRFFNDAPGGNDADDPGNGFLMRQGFTVVWSGWDGELLEGGGRMRLFAPIASGNDGDAITGPVRFEIAAGQPSAKRLALSRNGHGAYPPANNEAPKATLTWRLRVDDPKITIPRNQFSIHVTPSSASPQGQLPKVELEIPAGFQPGYLYELVYEARDPLVHGVTFASVRDLMTSFKFGGGEDHPLLVDEKPFLHRAIGFGVSQSGRYLREFVYWGFNADEQKRRAFDGVIPHVAGGGLGSFNHRFAQPTAFATQRELRDWNTDRFPFAYETQEDPHTGRRDGILLRSQKNHSAPLIMHTQSSAEYWTRSGSLPHNGSAGTPRRRSPRASACVRVWRNAARPSRLSADTIEGAESSQSGRLSPVPASPVGGARSLGATGASASPQQVSAHRSGNVGALCTEVDWISSDPGRPLPSGYQPTKFARLWSAVA